MTRAQRVKLLTNTYNTYLSDTVQTGNLTVSAGARFDYQQSRNRASAVPANSVFPELLPAVSYAGDSGYPITWRSVQPRVGATYALGEDRQTLLRASFARFGQELGLDVSHINAFPGIAERVYPWNDANHNGFVEASEIDLANLLYPSNVNPDDPGSSVPVNQVAPDLGPPETDEWIVGVERQLTSELSASIAYTHRRMTGPLFTPWIGASRASYRYIGSARGTITDPDTGFTLDFNEPYYGLTTDPPPDGTVLENRPDTTELYDGFELQLAKSFSNGWMLRVSFAYNNWRQQLGPGAIVDPNNEVPGTNAGGPIVEDGINATWQFNVSGTVELPLAIRAGVNLFGRQGFPILYYVEAVTNDTRDTPPADPDRLRHGLPRAERLPARPPALPRLRHRFAGHGHADPRVLQSPRQPDRPRSHRLRRLLRRRCGDGLRSEHRFLQRFCRRAGQPDDSRRRSNLLLDSRRTGSPRCSRHGDADGFLTSAFQKSSLSPLRDRGLYGSEEVPMNRIATKLPEGQRQTHRHPLFWLLLALLTLAPAVVLAQTWTTIDCPDALATYARSINERGEIVGICENATGEHGFLLRRGRFTMIDVPGAAEGTTAAFGINNRGDVVGRYVDEAADRSYGFLLRHGRFTTIDPPGSVLTTARGIDDLGRIVGFYAGSDDVFHGFILDSSGYRDVDFPDAGSTAAFDINALKQIVGGYIDTSGIPHGYLLKKGNFTSIDHPDAAGTRAFGINILGQIVGGWTDDPECPDCFTKAFLLTWRGFENLEFPGALETVANGINAAGKIVGEYFGEDEVFHGFLRSGHDEDD